MNFNDSEQQRNNNPEEMSKLRAFFWPIRSYEIKKFLPTALIMFCLLFCYTILRTLKDSLVISAVGAEVIPYIKSGFIMPSSILVMAIFAKLSNHIRREHLFYLTISFFISFFIFFALYMYPNRLALQPSAELIISLQSKFPRVQNIFSIFQEWTLVMYYVIAELWVSVMVGLFFWQFANEITRTSEAKRFYTMYALIGHLGPSLAGLIMNIVAKFYKTPEGGIPDSYYGEFVISMLSIVTISAAIATITYRWMHKKVLTDAKHYDRVHEMKAGKDKTSLSLRESIKYIMRSKYIGLIFIMVVSYGLTMNVLGLLWKNQIKIVYPTKIGYSEYMGWFYAMTSLSTTVIVFLLKGIIEKFGWYWSAMITPLTLVATSIPYFGLVFFGEYTTAYIGFIAENPMMLALVIITAQQLLSKTAKYSLFDPTKEMAYIPLDKELRAKGKAAVDVVGYSFSKASGGFLVMGLFALTSTAKITDIDEYISIICMLVFVIWMAAISALAVLYNKEMKRHNKENGYKKR